MISEIPLVPVNLATVALESSFYGAFFVLSITSISLLLSRYGMASSYGRREGSILLSPIFLGAVGLFITVTAVRRFRF
jgi:hypothetical protein